MAKKKKSLPPSTAAAKSQKSGQESGQKNSQKPMRAPAQVMACGRPIPRDPHGSAEHPKQELQSEKSWREKLEHYLSANELNQSESRNKLVDFIFQNSGADRASERGSQYSGHFTAQELIRRVAEVYPQIGAATIYRNLPILVSAGILKETLTDDSGQKYYEVDGDDHHDHIVCIDCNQIFEFHDDAIERAQDRVTKELSFKPVKHKHVVFASCGYRKK